MIEFLLLMTFAGMLLASSRRMGFGNPFQIYFLVWFAVLLGYYLARDTFIHLPADFVLLLIAAKGCAFTILAVVFFRTGPAPARVSEDWSGAGASRVLLLAQVGVLVAMPLAYQRAVALAGGEGIFSVIGYVNLRSSITEEGQGFGILAYFYVLSSVVTCLVVRSYFDKNRTMPLYRVVLSVLASLFYTYLSTGRTFVLFSILITVFPLVSAGIVKIRGIVFSIMAAIALFVGVATMTAKGISADSSLSENLATFGYGLRGYTIAPLLAFYRLVESAPHLSYGANSLRLFAAVLQLIGVADAPPPLIREYTTVPDLTNVYTVYEVYFKDFSYFGVFLPPIFLLGHWWLYRNATVRGGVWIFYYSASLYALVMQFFQDQYFSLLSMWIQIAFWFWLLLGTGKVVAKRVA